MSDIPLVEDLVAETKVASLTDVLTPRWVRTARSRGLIDAYYVRGRIYYRRSDLVHLLESCRLHGTTAKRCAS